MHCGRKSFPSDKTIHYYTKTSQADEIRDETQKHDNRFKFTKHVSDLNSLLSFNNDFEKLTHTEYLKGINFLNI